MNKKEKLELKIETLKKILEKEKQKENNKSQKGTK